MLKRSQKQGSDSAQDWYQDKYQNITVQRNILALIALIALTISALAVFAVLRMAPLKSVEPYLLQFDEKTGITQKVNPVTRKEYAANEAIDKYFTSTYILTRESYNPSILNYNYNIVRLMSDTKIFYEYRRRMDPSVEGTVAQKLGVNGRRDVKIRSIVYITNPIERRRKNEPSSGKLMQARITTSDSLAGKEDVEQHWLVTVEFDYVQLAITEAEQLHNPIGYQVTSYQIQREVN